MKNKNMDNWISVEDRLPEMPPPYKEDDYLVTPITTRVIVWDGDDVYEESCDKYGFYNKNVTHWMPLPEPPKKKEIK